MKRVITALLCLALIFSLAACAGDTPAPKVDNPQSYSDIYKVIKDFETYTEYNGWRWLSDGTAKNTDAAAVEEATSAPTDDYSDTNVQVEGIDEGDIVKTDGKYIYTIFGNQLRIYKADGENTVLVSCTILDNENDWWLSEMYVSGDKLMLIASEYAVYGDDAFFGIFRGEYTPPKTKVLIYDVTDRTAPSYVNCIAQDGYLVSSRMYDGNLYLVSNYGVIGEIKEGKPETFIPRTYCDDDAKLVPADCVHIMPDADSSNYIVATKLNIESGAQECSSVLGRSDTVYMSKSSLYIASSSYREEIGEEYEEDGYKVTEHKSGADTEICRIDLASMSAVATAKVPGSLESQFSMDEFEGNLRLVTTNENYSWTTYVDEKHDFVNEKWNDDNKSTTGLYILDSGLNQLAAIEGLAEDEYVRSVRFDGEFVYFCTFRQTDPLFAVNVADPKNPKILSEYKISGFSEYLHPWAEGRLFGLGLEADEETGRTETVKLVMFDVSDKADVKALHTMVIDSYWTEALHNHKALLISPEKGIFGFGGDKGYEFYGYSEDSGFKKLAEVSLECNWYSARGIYIGDFAYVVSESGITVLDMQSFEVLIEMTTIE